MKGAAAVFLAATLAILLGARACRRSPELRPGSRARLSFTVEADGRLVGGEQTADIRPGSGGFVRGLEEGVLGMRPGEERVIAVPPERGYGPRDPALVETVDLSSFGEMGRELRPGDTALGFKDGAPAEGLVLAVAGGRVTLDFNPPFAGRTLTFRVRVLAID